MSIDVAKAFSDITNDPRWLPKVLFGGLFTFLSFFLIGTLFILGYMLAIMRNVHNDEQTVLPEWTDLGSKAIDGLKLLAVLLVLALPLILLSCVAYIPLIFVTVADAGAGGQGISEDTIAALTAIPLFIIYCLVIPLSLLVAALQPAFIIRYAETGSIVGSLQFGAVVHLIRQRPGQYALIAILSYISQIAGGFGFYLCVIPVFFTLPFSQYVTAHLYGQFWRQLKTA